MSSPVSSSASELDLQDWIKANGRTVGIAAAVVGILAVGTWVWVSSSTRKEAFASQALMQARSSAESGNLPLAARDLQQVIDRFGGTRAADQAFILLNQTRLLQGQRDLAVNALKSFVAGRHDQYVKASAYALLGGALEDASKPAEAADAFKQASLNAQLDFLKATYLNDAARAYVAAHDTTKAKAAYTEVLTTYGRLDQSSEARVRMAEIGGVVPPPPPPLDTASAG